MARCHRIGQTKEVTIYRLVCRDTYEDQIFKASSCKYGEPCSAPRPHDRSRDLIGTAVPVQHLRSQALIKRSSKGMDQVSQSTGRGASGPCSEAD